MSTYIEALSTGDAHMGDIATDSEFLESDLQEIAADRDLFVRERLLESVHGDESAVSDPSGRTLEYGVALVSAYNRKLRHLEGRQTNTTYDEVVFRDRAGDIIPDDNLYVSIEQDRHRYMHDRLEAGFGSNYDFHDKDVDRAAKGFGKMYYHRLGQLAAVETDEPEPDNLIDITARKNDERTQSMSRHPAIAGMPTMNEKLKLVTVDAQQEGEQ